MRGLLCCICTVALHFNPPRNDSEADGGTSIGMPSPPPDSPNYVALQHRPVMKRPGSLPVPRPSLSRKYSSRTTPLNRQPDATRSKEKKSRAKHVVALSLPDRGSDAKEWKERDPGLASQRDSRAPKKTESLSKFAFPVSNEKTPEVVSKSRIPTSHAYKQRSKQVLLSNGSKREAIQIRSMRKLPQSTSARVNEHNAEVSSSTLTTRNSMSPSPPISRSSRRATPSQSHEERLSLEIKDHKHQIELLQEQYRALLDESVLWRENRHVSTVFLFAYVFHYLTSFH